MPDDPDTQKDQGPEVKPFAAWLQEHRQGGLHAELSDALAEIGRAVGEHDKASELTLKIRVAPNGANTVIVTDDLKVKTPEAARPASLFFTDSRGNLSRRDPRQPELPLRQVPPIDDEDAQEATA